MASKLLVLIVLFFLSLNVMVNSFQLMIYNSNSWSELSDSSSSTKIQVRQSQLLNFKLVREKGNLHKVHVTLSSDGLPEKYTTYINSNSDEIATAYNSDLTSESEISSGFYACLNDQLYFSIQMRNTDTDGDIIISISTELDTECEDRYPNTVESSEGFSILPNGETEYTSSSNLIIQNVHVTLIMLLSLICLIVFV